MKQEFIRLEHVYTKDVESSNLYDFNIHVFKGELIGLLPFNDTGLEKLIDVLCKNIPISYGKVFMNEKLVNSVLHNACSGNQVVLIDSKNRLVTELSVMDNIFFFPPGKRGKIICRKRHKAQMEWLSAEFEVGNFISKRCSELQEDQRCITEILRAMVGEARLIILKGLSDFLTQEKLQKIQKLIKKMSEAQYTFLYISSHYDELKDFCDKTVFMKNGGDLWITRKHEMFHEELLHSFLTDVTNGRENEKKANLPVVWSVQHLLLEGIYDFSLEVHQGECVGISSDRKEFQENLKAVLRRRSVQDSGKISIDGVWLEKLKRNEICPENIMIIEDDPLHTMLMYDLNYLENLCMGLGKKLRKKFVSKEIDVSVRKEYYQKIGDIVKTEDIRKLTKEERYTLIYYRIELLHPKVVVISRPFVETDLSIRHHIIKLMRMLKQKGISILVLSESAYDCVDIADKIIVIKRGKIFQTYTKEKFFAIRIE